MIHRLFSSTIVVLLLAWTVASGAAPVGASVVRIVSHTQRANWASPWDSSRVVETSGSGFVVDGGLVMTNAHVVSDTRLLLMYVEGDPEAHEAEIVHVGHDCDLALVRPLSPAALTDVPPLHLGDLPVLGSSVDTYGYPAGGLRLSSTRGIVSRIEEQIYVHSGVDQHLAVQTDAAINPGSSGGPVIQDGLVVGVAFQNNPGLENAGFFIPTEVVDRFLNDVEDGQYDGYPDLGFDTSTLENPAARARYGMTDSESGVRVDRLFPGSGAEGQIQVGDIILEVNGRPVANDGSVADDGGRIPFGLLIDRMFVGDSARLVVLRANRRVELNVPLLRHPLVESRRSHYDEPSRYFVYGGLVFVPLCRETLEVFGDDWRREAPRAFLDEFYYRTFADWALGRHERVMLLRRLDDPVNIEMAWFKDQVVDRVNGRTIDSLGSLAEAFEQHEGEYHLIEFRHSGRFGVLDRRKAEAANPAILQRYGIHEDRHL